MICLRVLQVYLFGLISFALPQQDLPEPETRITISAAPISSFEQNNPTQRKFGSLEFRGGLVLNSAYKSFGGISALSVQRDGEHFIALSDRGSWLRGRIVYENGRPVSIADAAMAPILDAEGKASPRWDAESIAEDGDAVYIGLERINNIMRFDYGKQHFLARGLPIPVPLELKDLPNNQGLEAMVFVPEKYRLRGTLLAFSEHALTEDGNLKAFLIGGPTPGKFAVKRTNGYDISDATILPDGDILILERQYSLERGVTARIRCIRLNDIKPDALIDGPILIETDIRQQVDNMEAMSVHRTRSGDIVLTLMSDDNFSPLQRTLLLQFTLPADAP